MGTMKNSLFRNLFLAASILVVSCLETFQAQTKTRFGVVNDKDIYAHARTGDNKKVVEKLRRGDVFIIDKVVDGDPNWYWIKYPTKPEDPKPFERYTELQNEGMINKDRVIFIDQLYHYVPERKKNSIIFTDNRDSKIHPSKRKKIYVDIAPYDPKSRKKEYDKDGKLILLDKAVPYGIGNEIPEKMTQIKSVRIQYPEGGSIFVREAIKNMFQPTESFENMGVVELNEKNQLLYMLNGEGAESYISVWLIKEGKVVSQLVYNTPQ